MANRFKNLRHTAAQWAGAYASLIIGEGEIAFTIDGSGNVTESKVGNGTTNYAGAPLLSANIDTSAFATISAVNSALNNKAPLDSPTFTGNPSGITKAHVGLGAVDNTADANKPVSVATANALSAKAPLQSPAFTGTPTGITKAHVGLGNVDNTDDTSKPVSTAVQNALNAKATLLAPVALGGAAVTLTAAANANRHNDWSGTTSQSCTVSTSGATAGDIIEVTHTGATGVFTFGGITVPAGYKATLNPGETGAVVFAGGVWNSLTPASSGTALATVTGASTTGSVLTCTPASGWSGTFQWTRDGTNISGATSATYTLQVADETHTIACKFTPTLYTTNGIAAAAPADVTAPAPSGAAHVDNASPTIVRQSFGEALVTNGIVAGDCTVTGHTVSSVAISGTELQITVSAPFVYGEAARTVSVAAGKLKDAAGNLCAAITTAAITNNVAAPAGSISPVDTTLANVSFDADGYDDWMMQYGAGIGEKNAVAIIGGPTFVNGLAAQSWASNSGINLSWTDAQADHNPRTTDSFGGEAGSTTGKLQFTFPADVAAHRAFVWLGDGVVLRLTLSDGSFTEQVITIGGTKKLYVITYSAASNGQTLTASLECTAGNDFFTFGAVAYKAT